MSSSSNNKKLLAWVDKMAALCQPKDIVWCDGSKQEWEDMWDIMRVKEAQRQEFMRRFYGRSFEQQDEELRKLLQYSMNYVDQPSLFRGPTELTDLQLTDETKKEIQAAIDEGRGSEPGERAGTLPTDVEPLQFEDEEELPDEPVLAPVEDPEDEEGEG